jgi:hypothetical protein
MWIPVHKRADYSRNRARVNVTALDKNEYN